MVKLPIRAGRIGLPYYPEADNRPDEMLWALEEEIRHCEIHGSRCLITFASPIRSTETDVSVMHFYKQTFAASVEEVLAACEAVRQERQSDSTRKPRASGLTAEHAAVRTCAHCERKR